MFPLLRSPSVCSRPVDSSQELWRVESTQSNGSSPLQHFNKDAMERGGVRKHAHARARTRTSRSRGRESIAIIRGQVQW